MAIALATTRQALADYYGTLGTFIGAATGDPGGAATPVGEATGGTPAYTRIATTWTSGSDGVITGLDCSVDVPPGTYDYVLLGLAATGDQIDNCAATLVDMSLQGRLTITPTYTQT
jgi:hypothetical protein